MMEGIQDTSISLTLPPSTTASASASTSTSTSVVDDDDISNQQMIGIFRVIDKDNAGYISITQLEDTIRGLVNEEHNPGFMEFIQAFSAYMETTNTLGQDSAVDVNKMDLDTFCACTRSFMHWQHTRRVKRNDSSTLYTVISFSLHTHTIIISPFFHSFDFHCFSSNFIIDFSFT